MRKSSKEKTPTRAKVCTIFGGLIVILVVLFAGYAEITSYSISGIEDSVLGLLICALLLFAGWLIKWGWKGKI